jgi:hypothetical protein
MSATPTFGNWNAGDFWRPWLPLAPANLTQPVLPGWTFNINSHNSSAPQTEADIVAKHSYGRQIGRMADALRALLALHEDRVSLEAAPPFADFLAMCEEIEAVKRDSAAQRLAQLASDLARLKEEDPAAYARLRRTLLALIEAE